MKRSFNRVLSFILTLLMLVSMVPVFALTATAAETLTVTDKNIGLSWTDKSGSRGAVSWSASGSTVIGKATGYTYWFSPYSVETKLTITNNYSDDRTLSFDYSLTGGGSVSGIISGTSGSYSATLAAGASTTITLTSPSGSSTNTLTLENLQLLSSGNVTSTFLAPENGSYTVDGVAVSAQTTKEKAATEDYTLNATPASGYIFFGWWSNASNSYVSYNNPVTVKFGSDPQLKPVFLSADTALFGVGTKTFADLTEAANYALTATSKTVVLLNNGTLRGEHTIPAGVTLLIPFDKDNTLYTNEPACTSSFLNNQAWVKPTAYRTLTMASDAKITVNGAISLSAKHAAANGGSNFCGSPTGPVSFVAMQEGSNITVNNGGNLYAWGFITGSGSVTANSGSTVYENFQITDFRGGSATTAYVDNGLAFPLNQYYVQNIEVPVTFYAGSSEKIYTSAYSSSMCLGGEATFIGTDGMFTSSADGYVVKNYNESRDRLEVDLYGSCELNSMSVNFSIEVDSGAYILPITNNVSINIHSGTTTLKQSVALLPGVELTIDKDATLNLAHTDKSINDYCSAGYNIVVYDRDEWFYGINMDNGAEVTGTKYGNTLHSSAAVPNEYSAKPSYFVPVLYAPGRTGGRTDADLKDAVVDVNGTIISNGFLYTTVGGASIISSEKTGVIEMVGGSGMDGATFQNNGTVGKGGTLAIMIQSASLMNGDGTYLVTGPSFEDETIPATEPGTTFKYCATHDCWYTGECEKCKVPEIYEITFKVGTYEYTVEVEAGTLPVYNGTEALTKAADANGHYTFAGWSTDSNATTGNLGLATESTTYYAIFTRADHVDTDKVATDGKHYCDICNYLMYSCKNENESVDHVCDYGCGRVLSDCIDSDTDQDHICDVCKKADVTKHKYVRSENPPTCTSNGTITYTCNCGDSYNEDGEVATGHTDKDEVDHICDVCGEVASECKDSLDSTAYKAPTCVDPGNYAYSVCKICGKYYLEDGSEASAESVVIPANGHAFNTKASTELASAADCENAATYYVQCDNCDAVHESKTVAVGSANGHAFNEKASNKQASAADCENAATYYVQCDNCDAVHESKTVAVGSANGHAFNEKASNKLASAADCENAATYYVQCDNCDAVHESKTVAVGSANGHSFTTKASNQQATSADCDDAATYYVQCDNCDAVHESKTVAVGSANGHSFTTKASNQQATSADCENAATYYVQCDNCDAVHESKTVAVGSANGHAWSVSSYTINNDGTHTVNYVCGNDNSHTKSDDASHDYNTGTSEYTCICGDVEKFTLHYIHYTGIDDGLYIGDTIKIEVPFGTTLSEIDDIKALTCGFSVDDSDLEHGYYQKGVLTLNGFAESDDGKSFTGIGADITLADITMPAKEYWIDEEYVFTGWLQWFGNPGCHYELESEVQKTGWTEIDNEWYYLDLDTGYRAEGITRVPYPTEAINGVNYAPNAEDVAYGGENFIDKDTALFVFGEDGKFNTESEIVTYENATRWSSNGMIQWHVGLVKDGDDYYYFLGDKTLGGGNIMATGDVYVGRNTTDRDVTICGIYTFDSDGKLCEYDGIVPVNGTLRYYEDAQLMKGKGLIKDDYNYYYYVRSNGELVVNKNKYLVTKVNGYIDIPVGYYSFDEDGIMDISHLGKNGIVAEVEGENTKLYFYENGKIAYAKGFIKDYTGISSNGTEYTNATIYVRSNGQLATGSYYIDNVKYIFNEDGIMQEQKNGIVDGYYYENGSIAYGKGLVKLDDGRYIYVRSNGQLATDEYWVTNVNETGVEQGFYDFGEDGFMTLPETYGYTGILDGYYYVDGNIAYGEGLVQLDDGRYIYVRSNGQLATGIYWITNHNDLLDEGAYDFGTDGYMVSTERV